MGQVSQLEERFLRHWRELGLGEESEPERDYKFHPVRKWRFDFAWPMFQVAVEIDGAGFGHQSFKGREADNEKQNAAVAMGWFVLRYTKPNAEAAEQVLEVISARSEGKI